jgi:hypothetical protein
MVSPGLSTRKRSSVRAKARWEGSRERASSPTGRMKAALEVARIRKNR